MRVLAHFCLQKAPF